MQQPLEIPAGGRDLLEAAALLHDIGYLVNHAKHHKHAYHLIMHGDLRGFAPGEVEVIANVARYHRRARPRKAHENFARLDRPDRRLVRQLSAILRVADGLDRTHGQLVDGVKVRVEGERLRLRLEASVNPQVEITDALRKGGLFERTFGVELTIGWNRGRPRRRGRTATRAAVRAREEG